MIYIKVLLFTHGSDIDGLGCVILARLAFFDLEYILCSNPNELGLKVREFYEAGKLYNYDKIYITDLALNEPVLSTIANDDILSKRIEIFDHHKSAIDTGLDKYDFTHIHIEVEGIPTSGTKLFYEHLVGEKYIQKTPSLDEFVELTRLEDTWEWKNDAVNGEKAHDLAVFQSILGTEGYIDAIYKKLTTSNKVFDYSMEEKKNIKNKKEKDELIIKNIWNDREFMTDEDGNDIAVMLGSIEYIGGLSEYVRKACHTIKYIILIDLDKEPMPQKSYRSIDEDFDVSLVAKRHGGGGHFAAAGAIINSEDKNEAEKLLKKNKREALKYLVGTKYNK